MSRDFGDRQQQYYLNELNRIIPVSATVGSQDTIQAALSVTDPELPTGNWTTRSPLFADMQSSMKTVFDRDQACRNIPYPGDGMRKNPDDRVGCGWWFPDDISRPSIGAHGSRRGPASQPILEKTVGTGQWIWDPATAYSAEALKQLGKIQSCQEFQVSQPTIPNVAWCTTGRGAAFVTTGPNQRTVGFPSQFQCPPEQVILRGEMCPPPPQGPGAPPIPPYAQPDFCIDGALSPACVSFLRERVCPAGSLGRQLATLSYGLYAADGTTPLPAPQNSDVQQITSAVNALASAGFEMDTLGILKNGQSTQASVSNNFNAIKSIALRGDGSEASRAALNLCFDNPPANPFPFSGCPQNPVDPSPYYQKKTIDDAGVQCIQQAAKDVGYLEQGAMIQSDTIKNNVGFWSQFARWGDLLTSLIEYKKVADTSTTPYSDRQIAISNVYGVSLPTPQYGCNINGVSMYRYYFTPGIAPNQYVTGGSQPQTHFLGRYNWKSGFPSVLVGTSPQTPAGSYAHEAQVFVTQLQVPADGIYQFVMASNFQAVVEFGGVTTNILNINTPTPIAAPSAEFIQGQRIPIRIVFYGFLSNWGFNFLYSYNSSPLTVIPPQLLLLPKSTKNPMFEIAVSNGTDPTGTIPKGTIGETTGLIPNLIPFDLTVRQSGDMSGAMIVSGGTSCVANTKSYCQGIRGRAFRSITMHVNVKSVTGNPCIFTMYNLPSSIKNGYIPSLDSTMTIVQAEASSPNPRLGAPPPSAGDAIKVQEMSLVLSNGGTQLSLQCNNTPYPPPPTPPKQYPSPTVPLPINKWHHIALVWDDDWNGIQIWVDGDNKQGSIPYIGPRGPMIFEQFRLGSNDEITSSNSWTGAIGWFRGFDYRLSQKDIQTDMQNQWTINSA